MKACNGTSPGEQEALVVFKANELISGVVRVGVEVLLNEIVALAVPLFSKAFCLLHDLRPVNNVAQAAFADK